MNYRSIEDLNKDVKKWAIQLPRELDLIVGIPRSGLLAAILLALHLNLPVSDIEKFLHGKIFDSGSRANFSNFDLFKKKKILIVDDTVSSGKQIRQVKAKLDSKNLLHEIYYGAVYISSNGHRYVDYWYEIVNHPRVFEWNIFHHNILNKSCMDIDGVLCRDPTENENDNGKKYRKFLINVTPQIIPTKKIGWLVTCRLEKYRNLTVNWLHKYNIRYNQLIMMDLPDKKTRVALGNYALYKAKFYKKVNAKLFIENSYKQALEITKLSGKPVFCTERKEMITPSLIKIYTEVPNRGRNYIRRLINRPLKSILILKKFLRARLWRIILRVLAKIKKLIN